MLRTLRSYWSCEVEQQHVVVELVDHGRDLKKIELKKQFLVQICYAPHEVVVGLLIHQRIPLRVPVSH